MSLNLYKSTWKRVRFGDVATASKEKVDPESGEVDRYVAGEHMDSDDLRIHRWGDVGDGYLGPAFHRRFHPGQVLYGSRRTYLRKVAVAEFGGVTANTTFVVETKDQVVLAQEFLPFIMTSEPFHTFSVSESKGSVNPYVNWSDLAKYEFDLPPLDTQKRLADLLWAVEREVKANTGMADALRQTAVSKIFDSVGQTHVAAVPLSSLVKEGARITYGIVQAGPHIEDGVPYIRVSDMTEGQLTLDGMLRTSPAIAAKFQRSTVRYGDLVVALRGRTGLTQSVPPELDGANLTQGTARVAIDECRVRPGFVRLLMNSAWMDAQVRRHAKGSTFSELTLSALGRLNIPRLERSAEDDLVAKIEAIEASVANTEVRHQKALEFRAASLSEIFGG